MRLHYLRFRPLIVLLLLLLILLQYKLWFEPGGILQMLNLKHKIATQTEKNQDLSQRNQKLMAKVEDLKRGNQVIESHARHDLGMVKKDETYYQIVKEDQEKS